VCCRKNMLKVSKPKYTANKTTHTVMAHL